MLTLPGTFRFLTPRASRYGALFFLLGVLCLVYWPSLGSGFFLDDLPHLVFNPALDRDFQGWRELWAATWSSAAGPFKRPLAMLSFALNVWAWGMDAWAFKAVNLGVHLLNTLAVFWLSLLILKWAEVRGQLPLQGIRRFWVALVVAGLWSLHPLQGTSVFYIIQRMNSLSGLFTWLAAGFYVRARLTQLTGKSGALALLAGVLPCFFLALLAKENALLLPYLLLVLECCFGRWEGRRLPGRWLIRGFFILLALMPALLGLGLLLLRPEWLLGDFSIRDFTPWERLLTEGRVLWHYLGWMVFPDPISLGLYHDDIAASRGWFDPPTTALAALGLLGWVGLILWAWRHHPFLALGPAWFLVGHGLESSFFNLELVFEHRNYVPLYGFCLAAGAYALALAPPERFAQRLILATLVLLVLAGMTFGRARQYDHPLAWSVAEAAHHPDSGRAQYAVARRLIWMARSGEKTWAEIQPQATYFLGESLRLLPDDPGPLLDLMVLAGHGGELPQPAWLEALGPRLDTPTAARFASNQFAELVDYWAEGRVTLPPTLLLGWLARVAQNPVTRAPQLAALALTAARVRALSGDLPGAQAEAARAVALMPQDTPVYLYQTELALQAGDGVLASAGLAMARQTDPLGVWAVRIDELAVALRLSKPVPAGQN